VSLFVIILSIYLMYFVRDDLRFFLQPREPADLGDVGAALKAGRLVANTHVRLSGAPDRKHALILEGRLGGYDSFFRLHQTANRVFIQKHREMRSTDEVVSMSHEGQLVRFDALPYHKSLEAYLAKTMTIPHDLDFYAVARAKGKEQAARRARVQDRGGAVVELDGDSVLWINVRFPDEWLIQLSKRTYGKVEAAADKLLELQLDLPVVRDEEPSDSFWRFVVHAEPDRVPVLMARLRDPSLGASVVQRQLSYRARWDQITVEGKTLVIDAADPTFPKRYRVERGPSGGETLLPVEDSKVRVAADAILFITTSSAFSVPPDAFVLLEGKRPGDYWYYALLYLVLLSFIAINAVVLVRRYRGGKAGQG
jgi:hypothetical protein